MRTAMVLWSLKFETHRRCPKIDAGKKTRPTLT